MKHVYLQYFAYIRQTKIHFNNWNAVLHMARTCRFSSQKFLDKDLPIGLWKLSSSLKYIGLCCFVWNHAFCKRKMKSASSKLAKISYNKTMCALIKPASKKKTWKSMTSHFLLCKWHDLLACDEKRQSLSRPNDQKLRVARRLVSTLSPEKKRVACVWSANKPTCRKAARTFRQGQFRTCKFIARATFYRSSRFLAGMNKTGFGEGK